MFPEMRTEPRAAHRTVRPCGSCNVVAYGAGLSPNIYIVERDPARCAVVRLRGDTTEGEVTFGEITGLRMPVVHLHVDVRRPVRTPRGMYLFIPDSLEICGLRTDAGTGDQKISTVIEIQSKQGWFYRVPMLLDALVCR